MPAPRKVIRFHRARGLAIGTVILAVALFAALAGVVARSGHGLSAAVQIDRVREDVLSQLHLLRQRINHCGLHYPSGANGAASPYFAHYPATDATAAGLTCPGSGLTLWSNEHGQVYPKAPDGTGGWSYANESAGGVSLSITAQTEDAETALAQVAAQFVTGEATYVAGTRTLTFYLARP